MWQNQLNKPWNKSYNFKTPPMTYFQAKIFVKSVKKINKHLAKEEKIHCRIRSCHPHYKGISQTEIDKMERKGSIIFLGNYVDKINGYCPIEVCATCADQVVVYCY